MSKGFIALPRSLETDSAWRHYSLRDRALFQYIIAHCVYSDYEYNLAGRIINLHPGQMVISYRQLTDDYNASVSHKCDKISKSTTYEILERFARDKKVELKTERQAGHVETLITIIDSSICETTFNFNRTDFRTDFRTPTGQVPDDIKRTTMNTKKKEYNKDENNEYVNKKKSPAAADSFDSPFMQRENSFFSSSSESNGIDYFHFANEFQFPDKSKINEKVLIRWFRTNPASDVYQAILHYQENSKKKFIPRPEAYIESSLKNGYWKIKDLREKIKSKEKEYEREKEERAKEFI